MGSFDTARRADNMAASNPIRVSRSAESERMMGSPGRVSNRKLRIARAAKNAPSPPASTPTDSKQITWCFTKAKTLPGCTQGHAQANLGGAPGHVPGDQAVDTNAAQ